METLKSKTAPETEKYFLQRAFLDGLKPPPEISICEWSDKNRILPRQASDEAGLWRTSRTPYLAEIMHELSPYSHAEQIVVQKGSQLGFTEAGINWILFTIAEAPGPMLSVQPTIDTAKRYSKQRLSPSLNLCRKIRGLIVDNKSREGGNTILQKDFPGGTLIIGGANSAAGLRSMPIKYLFADEIDNWPDDADGEGDPLELALKRTTNFNRKKIFMPSTPLISGISRVEYYFQLSDQRYYFVPCPHCGFMQIIRWENIKFENRDPKTTRLVCVDCKKDIPEYNKTKMLIAGEWRKQNIGGTFPGFHLSALYSPLGWYSWAKAVADHLKALTDPKKRQVWVNTVLGETWEIEATTIDPSWLSKRAEDYRAEVPAGVLCVTAGVDTQDDRIECSIWGWGIEDESWMISHKIIWGDPGRPETWADLLRLLKTPLRHESGQMLSIAVTCIDAMGHKTDEVYHFTKQNHWMRVFAIRGESGAGRPIVGRITRHKTTRSYLFHIGVDQAKGNLYSRLKISEPGPGFVHFPKGLDQQYFNQLTAEKRVLKHSVGLPKLRWLLPAGKRNEALDCGVYALAGLNILNPNLAQLAKENILYTGKVTAPTHRTRRIISKGVS